VRGEGESGIEGDTEEDGRGGDRDGDVVEEDGRERLSGGGAEGERENVGFDGIHLGMVSL
jgi:hypothetical protein